MKKYISIALLLMSNFAFSQTANADDVHIGSCQQGSINFQVNINADSEVAILYLNRIDATHGKLSYHSGNKIRAKFFDTFSPTASEIEMNTATNKLYIIQHDPYTGETNNYLLCAGNVTADEHYEISSADNGDIQIEPETVKIPELIPQIPGLIEKPEIPKTPFL